MSKLLPWTQELMWVQRNEYGVVVASFETLPETDNFIPYVPLTTKFKDEMEQL